MVFCCICGVHLRHKSDGIRFHRLPKNIIRRKQWLAAIQKKIKNVSYTENSVICSQHFTKDCFIITGCGKIYLKTDTIPTIFDMPLRNVYNSTEVDQQIQQPYTCDTSTTEEFINIAKNQQMQPDICDTGTSTEKSLVKQIMGETDNRKNTCIYSKVQRTTKFGFTNSTNLNMSSIYEEPSYKLKKQEEEIKMLKNKLKTYQQKCRRLNTKVLSLTSLVKHLKDKKLFVDPAELLQISTD